jgi:hypothetical protein
VEVHDLSPSKLLLQPLSLRAARGRGLQMVAALGLRVILNVEP